MGEIVQLVRDTILLAERGVRALERIADALDSKSGRRLKKQGKPDPEITETDRAAARSAARRMGLQVRKPR